MPLSGWARQEKLYVTVNSFCGLFELSPKAFARVVLSSGIRVFGDEVTEKALLFPDAVLACSILQKDTKTRLAALQLLWAQTPGAWDRWNREEVRCIVKQLPEGPEVAHPSVRESLVKKMSAANKMKSVSLLAEFVVAFRSLTATASLTHRHFCRALKLRIAGRSSAMHNPHLLHARILWTVQQTSGLHCLVRFETHLVQVWRDQHSCP